MPGLHFLDSMKIAMASMIDSKKKKSKAERGRGRPAGSRTTFIGKAIGLRLYPEIDKRLDAWIAEQDDPPSRPEAIRRLVQLGLDAWDIGFAPAEPARVSKPTTATNTARPKKTRPERPGN